MCHHPKASLAFNTNRKNSRQKLKCFKEITNCPGREKLECTDERIQVHKSTKQSRREQLFKSVSTECSKERLQEAAVPAESRAIQPLDKPLEGSEIDRTKREVGQVTERDRRPQLMIRENYGWQDSREAGDQAINQRMFSELR